MDAARIFFGWEKRDAGNPGRKKPKKILEDRVVSAPSKKYL